MALEQLRAYRARRALEELGPTEPVGPDGFPLLASSELRAEHEQISGLFGRFDHRVELTKVKNDKEVAGLLKLNAAARTRLYLAMIERNFAHDAKLSGQGDHQFSTFFNYGPSARIMAALMDEGVDMAAVAEPTLEWFACYRFVYYGTDPIERIIEWAGKTFGPGKPMPESLHEKLIAVRGQFSDVGYPHYGDTEKRLAALLGPGVWETLVPCEVWTIEATKELGAMAEKKRQSWLALLTHCHSATASRPSAKWLKTGQALLKEIGAENFAETILRWFPLVDAARPWPMVGPGWESIDERQRMHEINGTALRGLVWLCPQVNRPEIVRAVGKLATSAYRKVRGIGPRATKVGNACIYALSEMNSPDAVGQLALLKVRVKFGTAQKEIEKAFNAAAAALGLPRDQIEEMGVPTYGLEEVGLRRETFGDEFIAQLRVDGREAAIAWSRADGKPQKSVPAKVKTDFKEELKDLQTAVKDIAAMLPAQVERIDSMFLLEKRWPMNVWRERYLDHPLVGTIGRRLIWVFKSGAKEQAGIWLDDRIVDAADKALEPAPDAEVSLWHPIGRPVEEEVLAWRNWLQKHEVIQPFKQAHREVYLLTDAERRTRTYSNRFAAHILRQHQFNALCAARGWKSKLRMMVDDSYPPASRELPHWGLRAEYWIEGAGDAYGTDTNESGAYLRVATDQVRFYQLGAAENWAHAGGGGYASYGAGPGTGNENEPLELERVPPLVFSEIMRDVDLFVGVGSVGNDPTWQDGGPQGTYRNYWHEYSFGKLSETALTRRWVLERLLPRLSKIRDRTKLEERFLVVRGDIRTYKIHLGSGNILMEPNDQYLCIVPDSSSMRDGKDVFLPFEGDKTLSIILSKAFLLAEDTKIKDSTIVRQIKPER